jgi:hypothetical protein
MRVQTLLAAMKAIALYEHNPSSYVTKRHLNACLGYKPVPLIFNCRRRANGKTGAISGVLFQKPAEASSFGFLTQ